MKRWSRREDGSSSDMLARHLPLSVISEMVGLPEEGRQRMMDWAAAGFNAKGFSRVTTREMVIGNHSLPAGARVMTVLPAANRDERRYLEPDCFDITRDASDHVGFGAGIHRCVGANLAMMELTVMLQAITRHVRQIEVLSTTLTNSAMLRGFDHLEVRLH